MIISVWWTIVAIDRINFFFDPNVDRITLKKLELNLQLLFKYELLGNINKTTPSISVAVPPKRFMKTRNYNDATGY